MYAPHFSKAVQDAQINTRARLCAFVAELGHESSDLKHLREIWGPTPAQARYDVRTDLGNTPDRDGDGKKFMGRGGIQRTGKTNYLRFKEATGVDVVARPELLELPEYAFRSDALYWNDKKLNRIADRLTLRGDDKDLATFDKITKIVNGGYNGKVDRQSRYLAAIATLPDELFTPEPPPTPVSALDRVAAQVNAAPAAEAKPPEAPQPTSDVLMAKLSASEGVKLAGGRLARRIGLRLAAPFGLLLTALEAGNVFAWIALVVFVVVAGFVLFRSRHDLNALLQRQLKRISQ